MTVLGWHFTLRLMGEDGEVKRIVDIFTGREYEDRMQYELRDPEQPTLTRIMAMPVELDYRDNPGTIRAAILAARDAASGDWRKAMGHSVRRSPASSVGFTDAEMTSFRRYRDNFARFGYVNDAHWIDAYKCLWAVWKKCRRIHGRQDLLSVDAERNRIPIEDVHDLSIIFPAVQFVMAWQQRRYLNGMYLDEITEFVFDRGVIVREISEEAPLLSYGQL